MSKKPSSRSKALDTAERLFRSQGYAATGLSQIISESGAPKGSFYFHFPQGKEQLAVETLEAYLDRTLSSLKKLSELDEMGVSEFIDQICTAVAQEMGGNEYRLGCLLQNMAAEKAPDDIRITPLVKKGLSEWAAVMEAFFDKHGVHYPGKLAIALVAALEGARTLARVQKSDEAFQAVAEVMKTFASARTSS